MFGNNVPVVLIVVLFTVSSINSFLVCSNNACDNYKCEEVPPGECNKPNQDLRKGGWCNCCTVCFTTLGENEQCPNSNTIGGLPPTAACKEDLECNLGRCVLRTS